MTKPRSEVKQNSYYKDIYFLYKIMPTLKNVDEVKIFFKDILTHSELIMFKRRWHIAELLYQGLDIRTVARRANTSTTTVMKIKQKFEEGYGGLKIALERMKKLENDERDKKLPRQSSKFIKGWFGK